MKIRSEVLTFITESISIIVLLYFLDFYNNTTSLSEPTVKTLLIISCAYSFTGLCFRFSFYGQYKKNENLNDLIRLGVFLIVLIQTIFIFMYF